MPRSSPASCIVVQGGCLYWRPPFLAVPPCLLGGASPPLPLFHQPPIHFGGRPLLCRVLFRIFVVGAAPRSYSAPLSLYLPIFVTVRMMSDYYHWPCKGQTLLSLLASQPCVACGLIWVLSAVKCRRVGHFHSRHSLLIAMSGY